MTKGYSVKVAEDIKSADASSLGVRLGTACLVKGVVVATVAKDLGVSRQTVYHWFCGGRTPHEQYRQRIADYIEALG
jgi:transcriptional regulator with XRE-family HTH domain